MLVFFGICNRSEQTFLLQGGFIMPRRNYIDKKAYKKQKRKLENRTKVFADHMNIEMGLSKNKKAKKTTNN